jgi:hypothetical protein
MKLEDCTHDKLQFGSGDYYILCRACGASWMRRGAMKQEHGVDAKGTPIGAAPEESNKGLGSLLSGETREKMV